MSIKSEIRKFNDNIKISELIDKIENNLCNYPNLEFPIEVVEEEHYMLVRKYICDLSLVFERMKKKAYEERIKEGIRFHEACQKIGKSK